jgi:hypothetical protein
MNGLAITRSCSRVGECFRSGKIRMDENKAAISAAWQLPYSYGGVAVQTPPRRSLVFHERANSQRTGSGDSDRGGNYRAITDSLPQRGTGNSGPGRNDSDTPGDNSGPSKSNTSLGRRLTDWKEHIFRKIFAFGWQAAPEAIFEPSPETRAQIRYIHNVKRRLDFAPTGHPLADLIRGVSDE